MKADIQAFLSDYLAEMLEGNAAVFAGAGLSAPAGYVDWRELMRPLANELEIDIDLESDFVALAQFYVNANRDNRYGIHKAVIEALSPENPPTENHRLLAKLPIHTWWTTNYDKLIEGALRDEGKIVDVKTAVPQLATTRPRRDATIYKMHGDVERPDEAVATRDDYETYARDREAFVTALAGDLVSKTFLFLGFSFTDPNLEYVMSRVRLSFAANQRRHYAVFRKRMKKDNETDEVFEFHRVRQALVVEDLKRFNVKVLLVDEYSEITEFLAELVRRYRSRTVFVSASAIDFEPWGQQAVSDFAQSIGEALIASGSRVATGMGVGIGDSILSGSLREVMRTGSAIEDALVLRPFPQTGDRDQLAQMWKDYRKEMMSAAGIALFLFGNKKDGDDVVDADGMRQEFEIGLKEGVILVPVGATGSMASKLAAEVLGGLEVYAKDLDGDAIDGLKALAEPTSDLSVLVDPVVKLVGLIQRGKK